jgi:uncharacterized paraquat-inducible protein A
MGAKNTYRLRRHNFSCRTKTPCYCANCKQALTISKILDSESAWCPQCKEVVDVSWFRVQSWIMGVLVVLAGGTSAELWV